MEFLEEEARPRFLFQSRAAPPPSHSEPQTLNLNKPSLYISLSLSTLLFALSLFFFQSEPLKALLLWSAFSLLLGPFAPSSITGGDIRVGVGPILEIPSHNNAVDEEDDSKKRTPNRRSKSRKPEELGFNQTPIIVNGFEKSEKTRDSFKSDDNNKTNGLVVEEEEREWSDGDVELLKKQLTKHPVGKPRRWEVIAEAFGRRHGVESVIKKAKSMGEKKMSDGDSFAQFLKNRKAVDKRVEEEIEGVGAVESGETMRENDVVNWSSGEDIALLNALKAFPKEVSMRWEKIAAAVPGKSKAACVKRVAELKRDFRSSKGSS